MIFNGSYVPTSRQHQQQEETIALTNTWGIDEQRLNTQKGHKETWAAQESDEYTWIVQLGAE